MYRQHINRKPDFFAVLVLLVMVGFGLTVTIQVIAPEVDQVVKEQPGETTTVSG